MRIPIYLAVAQWALLFALGMLVIVMYRHLGRYFSTRKTDPELGPEIGSHAGGFDYTRISDGIIQRFTPGDGQATLLAFVGPTCSSCEELVVALGEANQAGDLAGVRPLLLISDPPAYLQISEPFLTTRLEIGRTLTNTTLEAYHASATPLLVAIDGTGIVRSAGPVIQIDNVRAFARACLLASSGRATLPVVSASHEHDAQVREAATTTVITAEGEVKLS